MRHYIYCAVFVLVVISSVAECQWQACASPGEGTIWALATNEKLLYAGTLAGVYVSLDHGEHWNVANTGLSNISISALAIHDNMIFAGALNNEKGTSASLFRSTNNGASWVESDAGIPKHASILSIVANVTTLFAAGGFANNAAIYRSTNNGSTWENVFAGPTNSRVNAVLVNGAAMFAATSKGLYRSLDGGAQWNIVPVEANEPQPPNVHSLAVVNDAIIAGLRENGLYLSTTRGATWMSSGAGLPKNPRTPAFVTVRGTVFAGTDGGVFQSINKGKHWSAINDGLNSPTINRLLVDGNFLFAAGGTSVWRRPLGMQ